MRFCSKIEEWLRNNRFHSKFFYLTIPSMPLLEEYLTWQTLAGAAIISVAVIVVLQI
jgi:hypothetical protein